MNELFTQILHDDITEAYDQVETLLSLACSARNDFGPELRAKLKEAKDALFVARTLTDGSNGS